MLRPAARRAAALVLAIGGVWSAPEAAADSAHQGAAGEADRSALVAGVSAIDSSPGSVPGPLVVYGEAVPVIAGQDASYQMPVVAAVRWERGRVVAFGHGGFLDTTALASAGYESALFMRNTVAWLAGGTSSLQGIRVGVQGHEGYQGWLAAEGVHVVPLNEPIATESLAGIDVLVWGGWRQGQDELDRIEAWVRAGGGLLAEGLGWGWLQLNAGLDIRQHPGNRLLAPAGILWSDGYLGRTATGGFDSSPPHRNTQASTALDTLDRRETMSDLDVAQAVHTLTRAIRTLPRSVAALLPELRAMTARLGEIVPTEARPITVLGEPLERLGLTLQIEDLRFTLPDQIAAHPAARDFPGAVPEDAPRVARAVPIDTAQQRWHSTGLYAPPGELVTVAVPPEAAGRGLALRIGAFTDENWHLDRWTRAPAIATRHAITTTMTRAANAFGGQLYIEVPPDLDLGVLEVGIEGAVEAPTFILGATARDDWTRQRALPAPYAEIGSDKVVLSVPSSAVRNLGDAEVVARFWDEVADAQADLVTRTRERLYPERMVADRQIGYGYMHAGYPIMTFTDVQDLVLNVARLRTEGSWGHFHELGHNHQSPDWTFDGTVEVTVNLFTVYTFDRVLGSPSHQGGPGNLDRLTPEAIRDTWQRYDRAGRPFDQWRADPFLALAMYIQLEQAFGWSAYQRVFAEYRDLATDERPSTDAEKRDQWLLRMSRTVNRNLCPFFELWAVPVSESACVDVSHLRPWDPWTEARATPTPAGPVSPGQLFLPRLHGGRAPLEQPLLWREM